jgi:hypothetical protein
VSGCFQPTADRGDGRRAAREDERRLVVLGSGGGDVLDERRKATRSWILSPGVQEATLVRLISRNGPRSETCVTRMVRKSRFDTVSATRSWRRLMSHTVG